MAVHPAIQPTLCVIGFPVAGNAMQFATERALTEAGLDWKFVSFNVSPDDFDEAVRGAKALGLAGLAFAAPFETQLANHVDRIDPDQPPNPWIDFLQPNQGRWVGSNQLGRAVVELVCQAVPEPTEVVILGDGPQARGIASHFATKSLACQMVDHLPLEHLDSGAAVIHADASDGAPFPLNGLETAGCQSAGCCVELSLDTAPQLPLGPQSIAISAVDVLVRRFANGFCDWTGLPAQPSTLREAIEEYFEL
ncbi:hypothetical protein [Rosistilla ulvae]|nr:hypothetical protein [Rosistilla ulvae]